MADARIPAVLKQLDRRIATLERARDAISQQADSEGWHRAARQYGDVRRVRDSLANRAEHYPDWTLDQLLGGEEDSLMTLRLPDGLE